MVVEGKENEGKVGRLGKAKSVSFLHVVLTLAFHAINVLEIHVGLSCHKCIGDTRWPVML